MVVNPTAMLVRVGFHRGNRATFELVGASGSSCGMVDGFWVII